MSAQEAGPERLSDMLERVATAAGDDKITVAQLVEAFRYRASGALLFLFAFPNVLPMPPGMSGILGVPLVILAAQLSAGLPPVLPGVVLRRSVATSSFRDLVARTVPGLRRIERLLRPRALALTSDAAERGIGLACLVLAIVLALPIPLGNVLPALAISTIALGMMARDGLWVLIGGAIGLVALTVVASILWAIAQAIAFFFGSLLG